MLVRLLYVSRAVTPESNEATESILSSAREHNNKNGITGVLCYGGGIYLQAIEGGRSQVNALYSFIVILLTGVVTQWTACFLRSLTVQSRPVLSACVSRPPPASNRRGIVLRSALWSTGTLPYRALTRPRKRRACVHLKNADRRGVFRGLNGIVPRVLVHIHRFPITYLRPECRTLTPHGCDLGCGSEIGRAHV